MQWATRRGPRARLLLILAALGSLLGGYYLGQYWQRRPLSGLSATVYALGEPLEYPAGLAIGDARPGRIWRLFLVGDTRIERCSQLVWHYAGVINRLAAWPAIQQRLRVTLLAYDRPDAATIDAFAGGIGWAEVISAAPGQLDALATQLGIRPTDDDWCGAERAGAILVAPDQTAWALIPYEQAAIMAHNIKTIITFVE
ncbi:MAG: hypothetical protein LJE59_06100 [Chromatiaceae bacterium]|nr:hypothetical protein [Chromatiaceae bacterium]